MQCGHRNPEGEVATISSADGGGVGGGGLGLVLIDGLAGDVYDDDVRAVLRLLMGVTRPARAVGLVALIGEKLVVFLESGLDGCKFLMLDGRCWGRGKDQNSECGKSLIKFPFK